MNAQAVANELGVTERTVRRAIQQGRLHATKEGRELVIDLDEARAVVGSRSVVASMSSLQAQLAAVQEERDWLRGLLELLMGGRSVVPGGLRELASSVNDPAKRAPISTTDDAA